MFNSDGTFSYNEAYEDDDEEIIATNAGIPKREEGKDVFGAEEVYNEEDDEIDERLEGTLKELQYAYKGLEERIQELKELKDKVWEEYKNLTFNTKNKDEVMNFHKEFGEKARELLIEEQRLGRLKPAIEERIMDFEH